jgi:hypothetical protein
LTEVKARLGSVGLMQFNVDMPSNLDTKKFPPSRIGIVLNGITDQAVRVNFTSWTRVRAESVRPLTTDLLPQR